jgi:hypothetical protein
MSNPVAVNNFSDPEWNEAFYIDPQQKLNDSIYQKDMNLFLAVITTVAFTIIAFATLRLAYFFSPAAIQFTSLATTALTPVFKKNVCDYFWKKANLYAEEVDFQKKVVSNLQKEDQQEDFQKLGVNLDDKNVDLKEKMKFILAQYKTLENLEQSYANHLTNGSTEPQKNSKNIDTKYKTLITTNTPIDKVNEKLILEASKNIEQLNKNINILTNKVKAAWFLHLMKNPRFKGTFDQKLKIYHINPVIRLLNKNNSSNIDLFLGFAGNNNNMYSVEDLMEKNIKEISELLTENLQQSN